jgi:hypothetical protein
MNKRSLLVLEIIWIATGILCLAAGTRFAIRTGGIKTFLFLLMALISFLFAWLRHRQRKKS